MPAAPARSVLGRRRLLCAILAVPALAACGKDEPPPPPPPLAPPPPPPPTIVSLTLRTARDANADETGMGLPVQVRILLLASANELMEADFFALDADPAAVLGKALIAEERLSLAPDRTEVWQRRLDEAARFVGIVAAYRDIDNVQWRAFAEVPREQTTLLEARLERTGVGLRKAGL